MSSKVSLKKPALRRLGRRGQFALVGTLVCAVGLTAVEPMARPRVGPAAVVFLENVPPGPIAPRQDSHRRARQAGAQTGRVEISLAWDTRDDIDLHAAEPNGTLIFFGMKRSGSGGELDVDMNVEGDRPSAVEHIRWPEGRPMAPGRYSIRVHHFRIHQDARVPFVLGVRAGSVSRSFEGAAEAWRAPQPVCDLIVDHQGRVTIEAAGS